MRQKKGDKGTLVCFEGGDAAGKTTLAMAVAAELQRREIDLVMIDKKSVEGFQEPYLIERLHTLRRVLWDYPREAPLWEWGDHHWYHLIVSWFSILDRCKVQPLLAEGRCVIVDNWYYKFAARFLLKRDFEPHSVLSGFAHLSVPDLVIFVDVDPRVTVTRRAEFSATESGRMDGHTNGGAEDFVCYQEKVLQQLRCLSDASWIRLDASRLALSELISEASDLVAASAERLAEIRNGRTSGSGSYHLQVPLKRTRRRRRQPFENFSQRLLFECGSENGGGRCDDPTDEVPPPESL